MKYLKKFENKDKGFFWKVPIKNPHYTAALLKIMPMKDVDHWSSMDFTMDCSTNFILLFYRYEEDFWTWVCDENRSDYFEREYEYKGEVKINQKDLSAAELYLSTKQYNL